jgi:hypothetical protein
LHCAGEHRLSVQLGRVRQAIAHSDKTGYYFAVQMFGRPHSQTIEFTISNQTGATIRYRIGDQTHELPPRYTGAHDQCRPPQVTFRLEEGQDHQAKTQTVRPQGGETYVVEGVKGKLRVRKK